MHVLICAIPQTFRINVASRTSWLDRPPRGKYPGIHLCFSSYSLLIFSRIFCGKLIFTQLLLCRYLAVQPFHMQEVLVATVKKKQHGKHKALTAISLPHWLLWTTGGFIIVSSSLKKYERFEVRTDCSYHTTYILRKPWELVLGFYTHHSRFATMCCTQQGQAVVEMVLVGSFK